MAHKRVLAGLAMVCGLAPTLLTGSSAEAANSPTFRDCSFAGGLDPDFVQISGVTVSGSNLNVSPSPGPVFLKASESSDPGDSAGHDTLNVTIAAPGVPTQTLAGSGTGAVTLQLPLVGAGVGRTYTISWAATFDNGNHACPSALTPENTAPNPFVVTVSQR